jgi:glycosyltransferase involved in cell wall biosynthesis
MPDERVLIISPVRDEAAHIEQVARSVAAQAHAPALWLVVDDGSTDGTGPLLRELEREIPCMRVVSTPPGYTAAGADRLAAAAAPRAFNWGLARVDAQAYDFIGKLDGDTELAPTYFEDLLARFREDPQLGIGGGIRVERDGDGWRDLKVPREHVPGALKLYRRACFEAIGGMQERLGWDAIDETFARMHGFRTRSFPELVAVHHREWGTADGRLRGLRRYGRSAYIARQPAFWVALRSLKVAGQSPRLVSGAAFLYGYAAAALRRVPRVEDPGFARAVRRETRRRTLELARRAPRKFSAAPSVSRPYPFE